MVDFVSGILGGIQGTAEGVVAVSKEQQKSLAEKLKKLAEEEMQNRLVDKKFKQDKELVGIKHGQDVELENVRQEGLISRSVNERLNALRSKEQEQGFQTTRDTAKEKHEMDKLEREYKLKGILESGKVKEEKITDVTNKAKFLLMPFAREGEEIFDDNGNLTSSGSTALGIAQRIINKADTELNPEEKAMRPHAKRAVDFWEKNASAIGGGLPVTESSQQGATGKVWKQFMEGQPQTEKPVVGGGGEFKGKGSSGSFGGSEAEAAIPPTEKPSTMSTASTKTSPESVPGSDVKPVEPGKVSEPSTGTISEVEKRIDSRLPGREKKMEAAGFGTESRPYDYSGGLLTQIQSTAQATQKEQSPDIKRIGESKLEAAIRQIADTNDLPSIRRIAAKLKFLYPKASDDELISILPGILGNKKELPPEDAEKFESLKKGLLK